MILNYLYEPSIAPLAYCARVARQSVDVVHGSMVAITPEFFHDGAWAGDFASGGFDEAHNCGTGGMLVGDVLRLVTPEMPVEGIFLFEGGDGVVASNSFTFLMEVLDDQLDVNHLRYRDEMLAVERGVRLGSTTLTTAGGRPIRVLFDEIADISGPGDIRIRQRPLSPPFAGWTEYRQHLTETLKAVVANAADTARSHPFVPLVTMSTGYDSCAVAVLAAEVGVTQGVTMMRYSADGTELLDHPGAVAATLGMELLEVERDLWRSRDDLPEAELAAAMTTFGDVSLLALDEHLPGRLMISGSSGDAVWSPTNLRYFNDVVHGYGRIDGRSAAEHRLHVGFIRFAVPEISHSAHPSIFALSNSAELAPWSIEGSYDRPIARRIIEEAGIQRGTFATRKLGASARVGYSRNRYDGVGQVEMVGQLSEIMSPPAVESFLRFLSKLDLKTYKRRMSIDSFGYRLNKKLDALDHHVGLRLHKMGVRYVIPRRAMRTLGRRSTMDADYTRWLPHWGVSEVRAKYRSGAVLLDTSTLD